MKQELNHPFPAHTLRQCLWLMALLLLALIVPTVHAQSRWQPPQPIPNYENPRPPVMVADQDRTVHAFNTQPMSEIGRVAIYYRTWSPETGWTGAHDIIILPDTSAIAIRGVHLDHEGHLHLVFYYGTEQQGQMLYTSALASSASDARSWTSPTVIVERAGPLPCGSLASNEQKELILIYCGRQFGVGLYAVRSEDLGETWSAPTVLQIVYEENRWPTAVWSSMDLDGVLHAVWSIVSERGVGEEIYYSRLPAHRREWSSPFRLARREGIDYSTNWPSIISHDDQLIVIYQDSFPATRFLRQSLDGGDTWTEPVRPFPHVGEYEQAVLLHDSDGVLHMLLGNRTSQPEIHGMWHSTWLDGRWTPLEAVTSGPLTSEFDPSAPEAVIVQGNILLVSWWNNVPQADIAWYSYTQLNTPSEPLVSLPTSTPPVQNTPTPTATASATPEPTPIVFQSQQEDIASAMDVSASPTSGVFWGIVPVLLLVVIILVASLRRAHKRF